MKILMMGLDNAGKTSIARNVFEGKDYDELKNLKPTEFVETNEYFYRQLISVNLFDCGGQAQFMRAYKTEDFKSQIFSKVDIMIWVVDSSDKNTVKKSLIEFTKSYILLEENSPDAKIYVLAHKSDNKKIDLPGIKKIMNELISPKVKLKYYSTSIKNTSARNAIKRILDALMEERMGDRLIQLQDTLHKVNKRLQSNIAILFNSEDGIEIASAFEKYQETEKREILEYISLKLTDPPFMSVLKQFKKYGYLNSDKSDFSFYRVGDHSICIAKLHPSVSLFLISSIDSLARIERGIEKFASDILAILEL
ncbi:MAG: ADP-ribosylation factor-like protein [Candidatus Helarchaeota archaeon]